MTSIIVAAGKGIDNTMIYSDNSGVTWNGLGKIFTNACYDVAYSETQDLLDSCRTRWRMGFSF